MKKRITTYVDPSLYRRLKVRLAELGISFTTWLQNLIKKELGE